MELKIKYISTWQKNIRKKMKRLRDLERQLKTISDIQMPQQRCQSHWHQTCTLKVLRPKQKLIGNCISIPANLPRTRFPPPAWGPADMVILRTAWDDPYKTLSWLLNTHLSQLQQLIYCRYESRNQASQLTSKSDTLVSVQGLCNIHFDWAKVFRGCACFLDPNYVQRERRDLQRAESEALLWMRCLLLN